MPACIAATTASGPCAARWLSSSRVLAVCRSASLSAARATSTVTPAGTCSSSAPTEAGTSPFHETVTRAAS